MDHQTSSRTVFCMKALCIYYGIQILTFHANLFLKFPISQGVADPITVENKRQVTKIVTKTHTRTELTQEQLDRIAKDLTNFQPDRKPDYKETIESIQRNLFKIGEETASLKIGLQEIKDRLPDQLSEPQSLETTVPKLDDLVRLLKLKSYTRESDSHIKALQRNIKEEISFLSKYNSYDFSELYEAFENQNIACESFSTRKRKEDSDFVTKEELNMYVDDLLDKLSKVKTAPLGPNDKLVILDSVDFDSMFDDAKKFILNEVLELVNTVGDWEGKRKNSCITKDEAMVLTDIGMKSLHSVDDLYKSMNDALKTIDPEVSFEEMSSDQDTSSSDFERAKRATLRTLIETPLYPKVFEMIDNLCESIAGYNDFVDRVIDNMGRDNDGRVGRFLEQYVNKISQVIRIPEEFQQRRKKVIPWSS